MKKFFIGISITLLILFGSFYLILNTPYVINRLAQKYLPKYHISYQAILGDPISGVVLERVSYKGRLLAKTLRLRINPLTLLKRQITVSRLDMQEVNIDLLERMARDFISPGSSKGSKDSSKEAFSFPWAFQLKNIHLTLLPFKRYGVLVDQEELSVDSIYYDKERFSVGRLRESAQTSLGSFELKGTYHKRFLKLDILRLENLDIKGFLSLLDRLKSQNSNSKKAQNNSKKQSGSIFFPSRVEAKKLLISMRSYSVDRYLGLQSTQIQGDGVKIDLKRFKIDDARVKIDIKSTLADAHLTIKAMPDRYIIKSGSFSRVDISRVFAWIEDSKAKSSSKGSWDALPFVPSNLDVRRLSLGIKPGAFEGIKYSNAALDLEAIRLDLKGRKILSGKIGLICDSEPLNIRLKAFVTKKELRISSLEATQISLKELQKWSKRRSKDRDKNSSSRSKESLAFIPPKIVIDSAKLSMRPISIDNIKIDRARVSIDNLAIKSSTFEPQSGSIDAKIEADLADLWFKGSIQNGSIIFSEGGESRLKIKEALFKRYKLPFRAGAFTPMALSGELNKERLSLKGVMQAKGIFDKKQSSLSMDIKRSVTLLNLSLSDGNLSISEQLLADIAHSKIAQGTFRLEAKLKRQGDRRLSYSGKLISDRLDLNNSRLKRLIGTARIDFKGDQEHLNATMDLGVLKGKLHTVSRRKAIVDIESKEALRLARYIKLPASLQKTKVRLSAHIPINLKKVLPLKASVRADSNLAKLDATLLYDGKLAANILATFPKKSPIQRQFANLRLDALNPLKIRVLQKSKQLSITLKSKVFGGKIAYKIAQRRIEGKLRIAKNKITFSGEVDKQIVGELRSASVKESLNSLREIYRFEPPKIDGDLHLRFALKALKRLDVEIDSKRFIPDSSSRIKSPIEDFRMLLGLNLTKKELLINSYSFNSAGMRFYAKRVSRIVFESSKVHVKELWINDSIKIDGAYDLKREKGQFKAKASDFKLLHQKAKVNLALNLSAKIDGLKIKAKGTVKILGGVLSYNLKAKHYASDDDIIILSHRRKNKRSYFYKNVQLSIYIKSINALLFKEKNIYAKLRPQLTLIKPFSSPLQLFGSISIDKKGYYIFNSKRLYFLSSSINFTGNPTRPLLDINLRYRRYGKTIYITVSGLATEPNLQFSSDPFMTRDQILSFILFDTVNSASSANDMLSLFGGGIAKSILRNLGLKVDTLIVTSSGFELGKKITNRITLLYEQREKKPRVIVRIQNSQHTDTQISIGKESQSADIIYRREF